MAYEVAIIPLLCYFQDEADMHKFLKRFYEKTMNPFLGKEDFHLIFRGQIEEYLARKLPEHKPNINDDIYMPIDEQDSNSGNPELVYVGTLQSKPINKWTSVNGKEFQTIGMYRFKKEE